MDLNVAGKRVVIAGISYATGTPGHVKPTGRFDFITCLRCRVFHGWHRTGTELVVDGGHLVSSL